MTSGYASGSAVLVPPTIESLIEFFCRAVPSFLSFRFVSFRFVSFRSFRSIESLHPIEPIIVKVRCESTL